MILLELASGKMPYDNLKESHQVMRAIDQGTIPDLRGVEFADLIARCLWNAKARPTAQQLLDVVREKMKRSCSVCCVDDKLVAQGCECNNNRAHFRCFGCVADSMRAL